MYAAEAIKSLNAEKAHEYLALVPAALKVAGDTEVMLAHHVSNAVFMTSQRDAYETLSEDETVIEESAQREIVNNGTSTYRTYAKYSCAWYNNLE